MKVHDILILLKVLVNFTMKILFVIIFLWIIYIINKFISGIQKTNRKHQKNKKADSKSRMDIQDAEYEEVE